MNNKVNISFRLFVIDQAVQSYLSLSQVTVKVFFWCCWALKVKLMTLFFEEFLYCKHFICLLLPWLLIAIFVFSDNLRGHNNTFSRREKSHLASHLLKMSSFQQTRKLLGAPASYGHVGLLWQEVKMADQSLLTESVVGWSIFSFILLVSFATVNEWFQ